MGKLPQKDEDIKDILRRKEAGKHKLGEGLFLVTRGTGRGYYVRQYRDGQSFRSKSLGTTDDLTLYKARQEAGRFDTKRRDEKEAAASPDADGPQFGAVVIEFLEGYWHTPEDEGGKPIGDPVRMPGHAESWRGGIAGKEADARRRNLLRRGKLASMPVNKITPQDVATHLNLWQRNAKTADRVRSHVEVVLAFATARKLRKGDNPAALGGPISFLPWPRADRKVEHHPAMPPADVPQFMHDLQAIKTHSARALRFIVLTAVRAQEAVGARWGEIHTEKMVWTIPGERMKGKGAGIPHDVPLTKQMLKVLGKRGAPDEFIFPGRDADGHVGEKSPLHSLRMVYDGEADAHGFRSTFSDWVADHTSFPDRERLADMALAHVQKGETQRAYARSKQVEKRRPIMQAWNVYVMSKCRRA